MPSRVLLVDDQPTFRMLIEATLGPACVVVGEAANGAEALVQVAALHPDIVVMDLEMPAMDGIEATRTIKRLFPATDIYCFTCLDDHDRVREMLDAGATAYYDKSDLSGLLTALAG